MDCRSFGGVVNAAKKPTRFLLEAQSRGLENGQVVAKRPTADRHIACSNSLCPIFFLEPSLNRRVFQKKFDKTHVESGNKMQNTQCALQINDTG